MVMIYKAYRGLQEEEGTTDAYEYNSNSYDFRPYQSQNGQNPNEDRGFQYNESIDGSRSSFNY